jgi:hypothetical protein
VLVAVDEVRLAAHPLREGVDLAADFRLDFVARIAWGHRRQRQLPQGRQRPPGARRGIGPSGRPSVRLRCTPTSAPDAGKDARQCRPMGPVGHGSGAGQAAAFQKRQNPGGDGGRQREIVRDQDEVTQICQPWRRSRLIWRGTTPFCPRSTVSRSSAIEAIKVQCVHCHAPPPN